MKVNDNEFISTKRSRLSEKIEECKISSAKLNEIDDDFCALSATSDFKMAKKEPTLSEMETIEEEKLFEVLENMNTSFKNKDRKNFISAVSDIYSGYNKVNETKEQFNTNQSASFINNNKISSKRSFSFDTMENVDFPSLNLSLNHKDHSIASMSTCNQSNSTNVNKLENIIKQNLIISEEVVKLIVIGEKGVGKSRFIEKMFGEEEMRNSLNYQPTLSLEIKRQVFNIMDNFVKIELWDTNTSIVNSHLIQTYYKITNGFILICDISNIDSIKFIEKQIQNIIQFTGSNLSNIHLFVAFKHEDDFVNLKCNVNYLYGNIQIKPHFIKLNKYDFNADSGFRKFIHSCLIKKNLGQNKAVMKIKRQRSSNKETFFNQQVEGMSEKDNFPPLQNEVIRDMSASPKKSKNDNCNIF